MWLHRHLHGLMAFAARTYYRTAVAGREVPRKGPVLLVANHPNALMDPALVASASERPVRFLARAPLFESRGLGWFVRGSGAIPVYRRDDDPGQIARNEEMFSAAWEALAAGSVVGVFPEGMSHSRPSLAPLKTGAARVALGAAARLGRPFPVLPVGITFRGGKERFRSEALILVGKPVRWDDLVEEGGAPEKFRSASTVRALTGRIRAGLSRVTVNLEDWGEFDVVEGAQAIHEAEFERDPPGAGSPNPLRWLVRMRTTARGLRRVRAGRDPEGESLAREVERHVRLLRNLGLEPRDLHEVPRIAVALRWTVRNLFFFGFALPLAFLGMLLFLPSHLLVNLAEPRFRLSPDRRASYRVLAGTGAHGGWVLLLAALLRELVGWRPALAALAVLPLLGLLTLRIRGRWREAVQDLKRILLLRGRTDLRTRLLERQRELALRIRALDRSRPREGGGGRERIPAGEAPGDGTRPEG